MKFRIFSILLAFMLLLVSASCGLDSGPANKPVNVATSKAAIKVRIPTDTPAPPTQTPRPEDVVKDLTGVQLALEDFPEGFKSMTFTEMDQVGMTPSKLAASFTKDLTKAKVVNPTGFTTHKDKTLDVVLSLVIYPLTELEISGYDMAMSEPDKFMADFGTQGSSDVRQLDGGQEIGEKSIAVDYLVPPEKPGDVAGRFQIVLARRGNAVMIVFNMYINSKAPIADSLDLARKLDTRLADALAK